MKDFCRWRLVATFIHLALVGPALAAEETAVINFAKTNANKFNSELVKNNDIGIGSRLILAGRIDGTWFSSNSKYNDTNGQIVVRGSPSDFSLSEVCKIRGKSQGRTAFGVKMVITLRDCDLFQIKDSNRGVSGFLCVKRIGC